MSRALLALALGFALGGSPLQWASSLVEVVLSATSDYDNTWDPNGGQSNTDYGNTWDPNG